jgi:hypothetical protein
MMVLSIRTTVELFLAPLLKHSVMMLESIVTSTREAPRNWRSFY